MLDKGHAGQGFCTVVTQSTMLYQKSVHFFQQPIDLHVDNIFNPYCTHKDQKCIQFCLKASECKRVKLGRILHVPALVNQYKMYNYPNVCTVLILIHAPAQINAPCLFSTTNVLLICMNSRVHLFKTNDVVS